MVNFCNQRRIADPFFFRGIHVSPHNVGSAVSLHALLYVPSSSPDGSGEFQGQHLFCSGSALGEESG